MKLVYYTYTILQINSAIDTGKYQGIGVEEVEEHIDAGDIIPFLIQRLDGDVDLSLLSDVDSAELSAQLLDIYLANGGRERRKWGIENSGLCLLVAWTNELIQQRRFND